MSTPAQRKVFGGVAGFGLSTSALDMLFCALGAVMLLFSMQEQIQLEAAAPGEENPIRSRHELRTAAAENTNATIVGKRPSFQLLPEVAGDVVFLLDLSGSVDSKEQLDTRRHIVAQFILQNRVDDFAIVGFESSDMAPLATFGSLAKSDLKSLFGSDIADKWDNVIEDLADKLRKSLASAAIPNDEIQRLSSSDSLRKLGWLEIVLSARDGHPRAADIIDAYSEPPAYSAFCGVQTAIAETKARSQGRTSPTLVLVSDGGEFHCWGSGATVFGDSEQFAKHFPNRISVSLVEGSTFLDEMQEFSSGQTGQHIVIYKFAVVDPFRGLEPDDDSTVKLDHRF